MATWFEIRVAEGEARYVRQACEEAFRLIDHLEGLLSRFREDSEVSAIARLTPGESLVLNGDTFACLNVALEMAELTGGAFDPTLGAAMDRLRGEQGGISPDSRGRLLMDAGARTVACEGASVALDLGAIGKGFALDRVAELLADWSLGPYLLVGGGSSILAGGHEGAAAGDGATTTPPSPWLVSLTDRTQVRLVRGSVGCSGLAVKGSHILDPRSGKPAETPARAWALAANAAVSDALSTAFMVLTTDEVAQICDERPEVAAVIQPKADSDHLLRFGRGLGVNHQFVVAAPAPKA